MVRRHFLMLHGLELGAGLEQRYLEKSIPHCFCLCGAGNHCLIKNLDDTVSNIYSLGEQRVMDSGAFLLDILASI